MARTPRAVRDLLERVWRPALKHTLADRDALQALVAEEGGNFALAPWDWRYYAEKLRQRRADFDDAAIKPYLALDNMIAAAFDCATRLFGQPFPMSRQQRHFARDDPQFGPPSPSRFRRLILGGSGRLT